MDNSQVLTHLVSVSARAAGLWAVAAMCLFLAQARSASLCHAVWTLVMGAMLLLPLLQMAPVHVPVRVMHAPPAMHYAMPAVTIAAPGQPSSSRYPRRETFAAGIWVAGVLVMLARFGYGMYFAQRIARSAGEVEPRLWESNRIAVPVTIGSRVIFPTGWSEWSVEKRSAILAHERAHVQRCDWAISAMASLNRAIFWFHPLAWWLERTLAELAEEACDDAALAETGSPEAYASALVEIAADAQAGRVVWEAVSMARGGEVSIRVERILNESRELSRHVPWRRWMAMGVAAIPVVWLASAAYLAPAQAATLPEPLAMSVAEQGRIPDRAARAAALARVRAVDAKIVKFKEENRGKLPDQIQSTLAQLQSVRARLGNADEQLASLQRRKIGSEMQLLITRMNYYLALRGNPGIRSVERQLAATEAEHARATETLSQAHPRIKQLEAALTALRAQLAVMRQAGTANSELSDLYSETEQNTLKTAIQNLDLEIEEKLRLVRSLNANIASLSSRIEALPKLEKCYAELLSEREHALEELERASTAGPSPLPR